MKSLLKRLKDGEILVADGAMGTMLFDFGLKPGEPPESFNLTRPEVLEEIARLYFDAGADITQTNTFGASPLRLSFYSLDDKTEEINRNAVLAVRKVVGDRAYVSASCGPSGRLLKPYGESEPEEIYNSFKRQIKALISAGIDAICIETMTDLREATLAIKAAKTVSPPTPVMATMTFDPTPRGFYTVMGVSIEDAAQGLKEAGADIVGSNCGNGIENMIKIAKEFKTHSKLPIIIQSNAGIPEMQGDKPTYPETPEFMAEKAKELVSSGVSIIGGCCGTTPEHIRAIRKMVDLQE
ncbi:MAG: homocysteine S-methyltransferase family protein [candidate division Zixibacteria bacterium]|nr:homocysteine S-methyltransferase family protein [candidate division Zixibacteria bacterium]